MASNTIDSIITQDFVFNIDNITSNGLKTGGILVFDSLAFESIEFFIVSTKDYTDGTFRMIPRHGDDSNNANHVDVPVEDLTVAAPFIFNTDQIFRVGYFGKKQFLSAHIVATNVTIGGPAGVFIVANTPRHAPTARNINP